MMTGGHRRDVRIHNLAQRCSIIVDVEGRPRRILFRPRGRAIDANVIPEPSEVSLSYSGALGGRLVRSLLFLNAFYCREPATHFRLKTLLS